MITGCEVTYTGLMVSPEVRAKLLLREPDWEFNEDGVALSSDIWRWGSHVNLHIDDISNWDYIIGAILDCGQMQKLVHGGRAFDIKKGMVYVMDAHIYHGVIGYGSSDPLIAYIETILKTEEPDIFGFMDRAIQAAEKLIASPQPIFEDA